MNLESPQVLFSATGSQALTPGASLRTFSQELLQESVCKQTPQGSTPSSSRASGKRPSSDFHSAGSQRTGTVIALEGQIVLLQQQIAQVTADLKQRYRLIEEKDEELERAEASEASLRQSLAAKDQALKEARKTLAEQEATLRDQSTQLAALEVRHTEALSLTQQQIEAARESRDEELERVRTEVAAASEHAIAEAESRLSKARAIETELRAGTQRLREENESLRSSKQRAEAHAAEAELAAQRAISQVESSVATLRQMESQYEALSSDAATAERIRTDRILELEAEVEALRTAKAEVSQERDEAMAALTQNAQRASAAIDEAKLKHQRAELAAADAVHAATKLKRELEDVSARCSVAMSETSKWREEAATALGDLERQRGAYSAAQSMLEATKLALESCRRDQEGLREEISRHRTATSAAEDRRAEAIAAVTASREKAAAAEEKAADLVRAIETMRQEHEVTMQEHVASMEKRVKQIEEENMRLQLELKKAAVERAEAVPVVATAGQRNAPSAAPVDSDDVDRSLTGAETNPSVDTEDLRPRPPPTQEERQEEAESRGREQEGRKTLGHHDGTAPDILEDGPTRDLRADELIVENARLRQQLAAMKISLRSPIHIPTYPPVVTAAALQDASAKGPLSPARQPPVLGLKGWAVYPIAGGGGGGGGRGIKRWDGAVDGLAATSSGTGKPVSQDAEDALDKAKRQVSIAKEYLRKLGAQATATGA